MIPMNNPMLQIMFAMRAGGNPAVLIQQLAAQNPQARQAMQMMRGKSAAELQQMAQNMAQERSIDLNQMLQQFGVPLGSNR